MLHSRTIPVLKPRASDSGTYSIPNWINPGAELGDLTGWTVTDFGFQVYSLGDRFAPSGANFFIGGIVPSGSPSGLYSFTRMYQEINLTSVLPSLLTAIDDNRVTLRINWFGGSFDQLPDTDRPGMVVKFYNASLSILADIFYGYKDPSTLYGSNILWDAYQDDYTVPSGTRVIRVELAAQRRAGSNNDAAFDEVVPTLIVS